LSTRKPIIAVSAGRRNEAAQQTHIQTVITGTNIHYVEAVERAGGAPVLMPCIADEAALVAIIAAADGLLLTGGGDVSSLLFGEEPHRTAKYHDPIRDEMELTVTRLALEREIPILGVCRGIQLLNVALGGTLIQDIPSQVKNACNHYAAPVSPVLLHSVDIEPDSLLARVMGSDTTAVNSYHHQAVKDLGRGLRVNCRAKDGIIEGVEAADGRPILAVQFHPEEIAGQLRAFQAPFDWVVSAARERVIK
jgi:gamma-glutamyl-gamma-aminobutyrate hydrolase PuuD